MRALLVVLLFAACSRHEVAEKDKRESAHAPVVTPPPPSPATQAIMTYASTSTCEAREKSIVFPERNRDALRERGCAPIELGDVDSKACDGLDAGTDCVASAKFDGARRNVWLVKDARGLLVDFRATELRQPSFVALEAQLPMTPVVIRAHAALSDYYNYEFADKHATHYSIELGDPQMTSMSTRIHAYIAKNAPGAQSIFQLVSDGQWHFITVAIRWPPTKQSPKIAILSSLVAPTFLETEAEHSLERDGG